MTAIEVVYAVSTLVCTVAGLTIVGMAMQAYVQPSREAMLSVSLGLSLAVAGAAATMVGAFVTDFDGARSLLVTDSGFTAFGSLFVVYSLVTYE